MTTESLNYSYPEFNGLDMVNSQSVRATILSYIDRKYGPETYGATTPVTGSVTPSVTRDDDDLAAAAQDATIYNWMARIRSKRFELGGGYFILIFLGDIPDNPEEWQSAPSFVGEHFVFVNSYADWCRNCHEQANHVVEGFVHLNDRLKEVTHASNDSDLVLLKLGNIIPYLENNLRWRIQAVCSSVFLPVRNH